MEFKNSIYKIGVGDFWVRFLLLIAAGALDFTCFVCGVKSIMVRVRNG